MDPAGSLENYRDLLYSALLVGSILLVGIAVGYVARKLTYNTLIRFLPRNLSQVIARAVFITVISLTGLVALSAIGIDVTTLALAGGFASIVVGLALQPVLANLFSGLFLLGEKSVTPGDLVSIGGVQGQVVDVSIMSTKLQTLDGEIVRIPNTSILNDMVVNVTRSPVRRIYLGVSIAYRDDPQKAVEAIRRMLDNHFLVLENPPPEVYVERLGDSGVEIAVRVWVPSSEWYNATRDLLWRIKKSVEDAGLEIPFNQVDVWLRTPVDIRLEHKAGQDR